MNIRKFIFQKILGVKYSRILVDNIFWFSSLSKEEYFSTAIIRKTNKDLGIGYFPERVERDEKWFVSVFLAENLMFNSNSILFDIGANQGQFLSVLANTFSSSKIYSFEPNPHSFEGLKKVKMSFSNSNCFPIGFGKEKGKFSLFTSKDDLSAQRASLNKDAVSFLQKGDKMVNILVEIDTLDSFCEENNIEFIDFLKIDVEGNELNVLLGASKLLSQNKINIIQFEFNGMNVSTRTFLKDFYDLLEGYSFFRLGSCSLIPLGKYSSENEIFSYQNIIAFKNI